MTVPLFSSEGDLARPPIKAVASPRRQLTDDISVVYQPFVNLSTGRVQGYEAFIRRGAPDAAERPATFLPMANRSDLICDLDAWVLRVGLTQLAGWHQDIGSQDLILAINLAARHVSQARVVTDVVSALQAARIDADRLLVDIGDVALLADDAAASHLHMLRDLGVCVCLDGSQLVGRDIDSLLAATPVDVVKLNPGFLDDALTSRRAVSHFVECVQVQGLPVVAGGIETAEQLAFARRIGCEWAQGFLLGEPAPAERIAPAAAESPTGS